MAGKAEDPSANELVPSQRLGIRTPIRAHLEVDVEKAH
eukprot:CAMPEP_0180532096 /NCGR_PEP_ID=MMETSP1036_2-20121128/62869_1 /TAXON_ID=632150 /ORGANISM="Azadinium spinosum, Strain 3D9" /LENGTH=37 /DNA_ID= /DNA_START= /DNA_END= /DNA_ORIENTATION=